ncbi:MAG: hypothetical protein BWY68_00921 [bacterium ADurb.Bin400]|nr:MAG: hypothetical protein BWY68_00921 [bacterium ADurb.Bin400]
MFTQVFPGMKPEIHTILLFGVDQAGRTTPSTTIEVFTRPYALTTVSGIIMPPTLALSSSAINQGDPVTVSGNAIPDRKVIIFSEPPLNSYEVYADIAGQYSFTISDTAGLDFGDHKVYAFVQDEFGGQSLMSHSAFFKVVDSSSGNEGEPPTWDISQGDLNGDTGVNLADFAILLYYWGSTRPEADINGDGLVNLADFSIMMFYWEG